MSLTLVLIIVGIALWCGVMGMAIVLPINPNVLQIVKPFVCPRGSRMEVKTYVYPYHRPGEKAISIYCIPREGEPYSIKIRALVALVLLFTIIALPFVIFIVWWLNNSI